MTHYDTSSAFEFFGPTSNSLPMKTARQLTSATQEVAVAEIKKL
jgi:hypothetical protein